MTDGRLTIAEIQQAVGISYGSVQFIIWTKLQFQKMLTRWVPKLLIENQRTVRVEISQRLLTRYFYVV